MKYISTWSMEPFFHSTSTGWLKDEYVLASMLSSLDHVKKIGEKPAVYADKVTCEVLSDLIDGVDLYDVHTDLFVRDNVPREFWAYPKIKTYSMQTEPYVHFDLDFMIRKRLDQRHFEKDVLCQCWEFPKELIKSEGDHIPQTIYNKEHVQDYWEWSNWWQREDFNNNPALNVGILGMQNMELNEIYCNLTFEWLDMNRDKLFEQRDKMPHSCVFEQQALGMLVEGGKYRSSVLTGASHVKPPLTKEFVHFLGNTYKQSTDWKGINELREIFIEPYITEDVVRHTKKLVEKRI